MRGRERTHSVPPTVTTATTLAHVDPSFCSRMTHSILTRWMFETGHDGRPRGMSGNRRMGRFQPTWLNTTIRLVKRLVEVVKPISGLRNIGTAQLPMSKL